MLERDLQLEIVAPNAEAQSATCIAAAYHPKRRGERNYSCAAKVFTSGATLLVSALVLVLKDVRWFRGSS
jgi:hypothetical protein